MRLAVSILGFLLLLGAPALGQSAEDIEKQIAQLGAKDVAVADAAKSLWARWVRQQSQL